MTAASKIDEPYHRQSPDSPSDSFAEYTTLIPWTLEFKVKGDTAFEYDVELHVRVMDSDGSLDWWITAMDFGGVMFRQKDNPETWDTFLSLIDDDALQNAIEDRHDAEAGQ